jgi:hypothetical protein
MQRIVLLIRRNPAARGLCAHGSICTALQQTTGWLSAVRFRLPDLERQAVDAGLAETGRRIIDAPLSVPVCNDSPTS